LFARSSGTLAPQLWAAALRTERFAVLVRAAIFAGIVCPKPPHNFILHQPLFFVKGTFNHAGRPNNAFCPMT
jgi:hypothetical protein